MTARRFVVGQAVRMSNRFGLPPSAAGTYHITAILPAREDNSPQYRIRNDDELYERVATEDALEEMATRPAPGDAPPEQEEFENG